MNNEMLLSPIIIQSILNVIIPIRVLHIILFYIGYKIYKMMKKARII